MQLTVASLGSPYLSSSRRLSDVIAAIQALGTYKYYKQDFAEWADRITGDTEQGAHWKKVFEDHPEFFRLDSKKERASLVLRRQRQKLYNVDEERLWSKKAYDDLLEPQKLRFSRSPLSPVELEALIDVAINLHTRATESARERRWFVAPFLAFIGALAGALLAK